MLKYFITFFSLSLIFDCSAQDTASQFNTSSLMPNHPGYERGNHVFLLPIEQVSSLTIEGIGKTKTYVLLDSMKSQFRIKNLDEPKFVVKCIQVDAGSNPFAFYRLYSLTVNERKKRREYLSVTQKSGIQKSSIKHNAGLPLDIKASGKDTFSLLLPKLKPGEYALRIADVIYSFGVD